MLIVERQRNASVDLYVVRSKEPGCGRGWKVKNLTLKQAQLAVEHYFVGHTGKRGCALCRPAGAKP